MGVFADGVEAYRRRKKYKSTWDAVQDLGRQAEYKRPDKLYRFMNGKDRPEYDRALILAKAVKRRPEDCWPSKKGRVDRG